MKQDFKNGHIFHHKNVEMAKKITSKWVDEDFVKRILKKKARLEENN